MPNNIAPYIVYLSVIEPVDVFDTSIFAGIPPSVIQSSWTYPFICSQPTSILEPASEVQTNISRRLSGASYRAFTVSRNTLPGQNIPWEWPFAIALTSTDETASIVDKWVDTQRFKPLHISLGKRTKGLPPTSLTQAALQEYCHGILEQLKAEKSASASDVSEWREVVKSWKPRSPILLDRIREAHNCTDINNLCLESAGYRFKEVRPFSAEKTADFVREIVKSYQPIDLARDEIPISEAFRIFTPLPELILFAPGMFRHIYERKLNFHRAPNNDLKKILQSIQRQTGYALEISGGIEDDKLHGGGAIQRIIETRKGELRTLTGSVAIRAAGNFSTTLRLPMGTNQSLGMLRQFANTVRASDAKSRAKRPKLFDRVQKELSARVPPDLINRISETKFGIKLISDIALEWLPMDGLPLGMRFNVSRIPATPGSLCIDQLNHYRGIGLEPANFRAVLHLDATLNDDPIRPAMEMAIGAFGDGLKEKLQIHKIRVSSVEEFLKAINSFDGPMMLFDGHGVHDRDTNIGKIMLGREAIDVWELKGKVNVPPIVFLSSCDAHALDRSHATTANGFLSLGAQSVIAPLLPIDAFGAAALVARFLFRLVDFVPAALKEYGNSLRWNEIVAGMMRMQLTTDIVGQLIRDRIISMDCFETVSLQVISAINGRRADWYEVLIQAVEEEAEVSIERAKVLVGERVALSDAILYCHLGNPEYISIAPWSEIPALTGSGSEFWPRS